MKSLSDILSPSDTAPQATFPEDLESQLPDVSLETPAKEFCRKLLSSSAYRRSLLSRVVLGTLPPAMELRIWDYAHGKPTEKIEMDVKDSTVRSPSELRERAEMLLAVAREVAADETVN